MGCGHSTSTSPVVVPAEKTRGFDLVVLNQIHIVRSNNQIVKDVVIQGQLAVRPDSAIPPSKESSLLSLGRKKSENSIMPRLNSDGNYQFAEGKFR